MVWTREQQTAAFARAKAEFLEIDDDDDPLAIALADLGISKFRDFFTISLSSVDNMHYRAAVPVGETLTRIYEYERDFHFYMIHIRWMC